MRKRHVALLHKKFVYALSFFCLSVESKTKAKRELAKWKCRAPGFSFHFHLLSVMFWKDSHILLGNQEWSNAASSSLGQLSANSNCLLVSSLRPSQRWVLRLQLCWEEVSNGRTRRLQVPEKLQLQPFALPHSVPWCNALGDIKFVFPKRGKLKLLGCIIQLIKIRFQRREQLVILSWHKLTLLNHQQKANYDGAPTVFSCGAEPQTNANMELWGE